MITNKTHTTDRLDLKNGLYYSKMAVQVFRNISKGSEFTVGKEVMCN